MDQITTQEVEALLAQGEIHLLNRDLMGIKLFEQACELDSSNPQIFLRQALAIYEYAAEEKDEKLLLTASRKLKLASQLDPESYRIWQVWGDILLELGRVSDAYHYFLEAKEKLSKALSLLNGQTEYLADLYWSYGSAWRKIAEHSGEALDLQMSVDAFGKTSSLSDQLPEEFWYEHGHSCLDLAWNINDTRLYVKAISCFKNCISISVSSYEGWTSLAKALHMLYEHTHDEDHFTQANECYSAAAQLHPQDDATLWLNWAKFLCEAGRRHQDTKKLRASIEKCIRAHSCDPDHPLVIGVWAEALALIGQLTDSLELIYEAQNKINELPDTAFDHPDIWFSFGMCTLSAAHYHNDIDYLFQAIEKFQEGLSIDRTCYRHWHAIASAYAMIGQLEGDSEALLRACRFYNKAIALNASSYYIYDYAVTLSRLGELIHQQKWFEESIIQFEKALAMQKNAIYLHPDWLFHYASTLDMLGDFYEDKSYYTRAIEILSHVLMIDPDFPHIHHRMALAFSHLADLLEESEHFYRAIHHYRLASKHEEENDHILIDWSVTLINLTEYIQDSAESDQMFRDAEHKLIQAAKLGNPNSYYHLACLYSLQGIYEKSLFFIEKAEAFNALPTLEEMLEDDWLEGLRATSDFRSFLSQLEKKPNLHEER